MNKKSAGIILYRKKKSEIEVMLVHPGGPFWSKKDDGAWSIPKGEFEDDEEPLIAAKREFNEELGKEVSAEEFIELQPVKSKSRKIVFAFAAEQDFETNDINSNLCVIDWPPHSGKQIEIPEIDRAEWFNVATCKKKIVPYMLPLIDELNSKLKSEK